MQNRTLMHNIAEQHNHQRCIDDAMTRARELCQHRQVKFTRIREQVLACVWANHQPVGAYTILEELAKDSSRRPAPPTVYRALDFLLDNGLVHRIASLNAFVGCKDPSHHHQGHFLICRQCRNATELDTDIINTAIKTAAKQHGFTVEAPCVEVVGCCAHCQEVGGNE
jgi:Fur family zinc uptake transcriptional regulator